MYDLIVIGAGPGGYEAAAHAARMGKNTVLIEKQYIGGTCLNVGCIPSKTLLKSSHVFAACKEAELYGIKTAFPEINLAQVQERKVKVVTSLTKGVEGMLKKSGVKVVQAEATITGKGVVKAAGTTYEGSNILISTGSRPALAPIKGIDSASVIDSTGALEIDTIPESLIIIGGGVIGLEFASFFSEIGTKVTIIELLASVGAGLDSEITHRLMIALKRNGIVFNLSSTVTEIRGKEVHFTNEKGEIKTVEGTYILNATGRSPVIENLGLEELGVDFSRQGIVTSDEGKTNIPGIWACGDVTGRCLLAHVATREGLVAVNNMFGKKEKMRYDAIPWVIYTSPEVAGVGKTEEQLKAEDIDYKKSVMPMGIAGRFMVENEKKSGAVKVLAGKKYGEILGVHMIGADCSEMIFGAAMMVETQMRLEDIREIIFPHPTVSEALKETILQGERS